ncbi:hypothetical protein M9H77_10172 [Catharanthus roseus]|uniref:Uncharacterized protein n=1 Tax=Catharanthus roseus TaxID=4058 RepID=A0ACC0C2N6_CATRO|nr:hypothetical protein M9H77_10172 [Catharanthus roseus]
MARILGVTVEEEEAPIHGDVLEQVLSHVPLINLVPAFHVSKAWRTAVYSSLHSLNPPKPWLFFHRQTTRSSHDTVTFAYDPRSCMWIQIFHSFKYVSTLKSSNSNFLYDLSPSKLSFSFDPLKLTWYHVDAPLVWRFDPIVAKVGDSIVIAGGACDFEDDPLAVEIYDMKNRKWRTCNSMPVILRDSAASTWLSVTSTSGKLFVMEKRSGTTYFFNLESDNWSGPHDFRPDESCFYSVIGCLNDRLILVSLIGTPEEVKKVKIWEVEYSDNFSCKEIGEMPIELVRKLRSETFGTCSINICLGGNVVYIYNPVMTEVMVVCEVVNGGNGCHWSSLRDVIGGCGMETTVVTCGEVGIDDLTNQSYKLSVLINGLQP